MQRISMLALASMIRGLPRTASAHGTVGDYTFLEPIVAEDANPKNECDLLAPVMGPNRRRKNVLDRFVAGEKIERQRECSDRQFVDGHVSAQRSPCQRLRQSGAAAQVGFLYPGEYTVRWSVVAEDGHRTGGYYTFTFAPGR
jgi:CopC domain